MKNREVVEGLLSVRKAMMEVQQWAENLGPGWAVSASEIRAAINAPHNRNDSRRAIANANVVARARALLAAARGEK